ncbi:MAG: transglycosylase domain-containing protein [Gemmatimonadota bacterium]
MALASPRSKAALRLLARVTVGVSGLGILAVAGEASFRARLNSPEARVPTAIYSRPTPWGGAGGGDGVRRAPIAIGAIDQSLVEERIPVRLRDVPRHLIQAVLAVEDQRFYQHNGLDFRRIGGALLANLRARGIVQGGSTLTQQLVKNLFLSADRTPLRKLREAAFTSVLEEQYDKAVILEAYLNEIYLGQDGGLAIHGVGAAARYYFGKDVRRISLAEAALLAGMISAPNRYSPIRHPTEARDRRNLVLQLMADQKRIPTPVAGQTARARVAARVYPARTLDSRYFRDFALAGLPGRLPDRGVAVYTTLDATLQRAAERAVRDGLSRFRVAGVEAALIAIDPRNGEVLAMVGGRDYGASQFNRATDAHRQPGSAFKPVVALAALQRNGDRAPAFTLASVVEDEPLSVRTPTGPWEPSNYDRSFRGLVTFRQAIEQSLNVPFVRIGLTVGPEQIVATARRLGITSSMHAVPSLALGSSEVTLLELVRSYGVFATGGDLATARTILGQSRSGRDVGNATPPEVTRVADPAAAYLVTSALEGVITRGTGRALAQDGRFGGIAGKTGTSSDWRDAWFVAYSSSLVVGAWVGFDDGRSLHLTGASAALPIVKRFLEQATPDDQPESFPVPEGVEFARVGGGESEWSPDCGTQEVFLAGTAPEETSCDRFEAPAPEWRSDEGGVAELLRSRARRLMAQLFDRRLERGQEESRRDDDWRRRARGRDR